MSGLEFHVGDVLPETGAEVVDGGVAGAGAEVVALGLEEGEAGGYEVVVAGGEDHGGAEVVFLGER